MKRVLQLVLVPFLSLAGVMVVRALLLRPVESEVWGRGAMDDKASLLGMVERDKIHQKIDEAVVRSLG